jgi:hypothetical protein
MANGAISEFFMVRDRCSAGKNFQAEDFAGFAFGEDLEGTAADFAVGGEALRGDAGVNH